MPEQLPDAMPMNRLAAACRALGLPPERVRMIHSDAQAGYIEIALYELDEHGRKLAEEDGDPIVRSYRLPFGDAEPEVTTIKVDAGGDRFAAMVRRALAGRRG
ncbi:MULTISPECIES: hypothetical protein [Streptomyces]|uniref:hypothetical protein n=1 Tax=Streptomyces TaxID=1883 RepID=UPI00186AEAF8|nr:MULTISPECIES: hypothetical protein [Streptomyces]